MTPEQKLDRVLILAEKNSKDLEHHIKRTDLLESHIKLNENYNNKHIKLANLYMGGSGLLALSIIVLKVIGKL